MQGQEPLTASMLAEAPHQEQKQMLGERLFPLIHGMYPDMAGKITGMLLEIDNSELLHMLESRESLKAKVSHSTLLLTYSLLAVSIGNEHTHSRVNGSFAGLPRRANTRKVKPIWILLKQETASGSGVSWAMCKSTPRSRQITMPAPHHSVFYRPDALWKIITKKQ